MSMEVFEQALERSAEMKQLGHVEVNLCGLGEPLLNKHTPTMVARAREAGFGCGMSSNAALLDERRGAALLEAGLQRVFINVGDLDDDYEEVYKLPFEKTRDNVVRFHEMAGDQCDVTIVLVNYRQSREHLEAMRTFWREFGLVRFAEFEIMNRGGALFVDHMQYSQYPQRPAAQQILDEGNPSEPTICTVPFNSVFIGYDGNFYLCCSDWKKEAPVGNVFHDSPFSVMEPKLAHLFSGEPVCKTCNLDPVNRLTDMLRDIDAGDATREQLEELSGFLFTTSQGALGGLNKLQPGISDRAQVRADEMLRAARRIPVAAL